MNFYDVIFAQQKTKMDSKYFGEISDAINVLAGTETTYTPAEMAPAILDAIPTETASGNPINITDAANFPAEECVTTLEPVQDLHGYDKPWPDGGGKNLFPYAIASKTEQGNLFNFSTNLPSGTYTLSFSSLITRTTYMSVRIDYVDGSIGPTVDIQADQNFGVFNLTKDANHILWYVRENTSIEEIQLELGTTATAYEPYSNECPISGHTGVELTRTGKNLLVATVNSIKSANTSGIWNDNSYTLNDITFTIVTDTTGNVTGISVNGTSSAWVVFNLNVNQRLVANDYKMTCSNASNNCYLSVNVNGTEYAATSSESERQFSTSTDDVIAPVIVIRPNVTVTNTVLKPMIRLATDTDATFEPYQGETHSITFPALGKNLLDIIPYAEWQPTYYEVNNDVLTLLRQDSFPFITIERPSLTLSAGTYSISTSNTSIIQVYNITTGTEITREPNPTFTLAENATIGIKILSDSYPFVAGHVMLELGNQATTYEPYTNTAYGCEVDWVNGVLRVDRASLDITYEEQLSGFTTSSDGAYASLNQAEGLAKIDQVNVVCICSSAIGIPYISRVADAYKNECRVYSNIYNEVVIRAGAGQASTKTELFNIYNGAQVVYELATPIEIPLTPEVITLLKGENNVWTDAGTSEIEYKVDLNSYIQKLIDEASAQASTLSVSPLSLGRSAAVSTNGESEEAEELPVEDVESVDEVEEEPAENKKADEPVEEKEVEDLTVKKEIIEELAETERVEDIKETEEHESEVEE